MDDIAEILIKTIFVYPGAFIRWAILGFKKPYKDYVIDFPFFNSGLSLVLLGVLIFIYVNLLS